MITQIIHELLYNNRKYLINELISVEEIQKNLYEVRLLTYESHHYVLKLNSDQWGDNYSIEEVALNPSYEMTTDQVPVMNKNDQHSSLINFMFVDPLHKIFEQEFNHLVFSTVKDFAE